MNLENKGILEDFYKGKIKLEKIFKLGNGKGKNHRKNGILIEGAGAENKDIWLVPGSNEYQLELHKMVEGNKKKRTLYKAFLDGMDEEQLYEQLRQEFSGPGLTEEEIEKEEKNCICQMEEEIENSLFRLDEMGESYITDLRFQKLIELSDKFETID